MAEPPEASQVGYSNGKGQAAAVYSPKQRAARRIGKGGSGLKHMKRCAVLLVTALLWVCLASGACIADAGAEGLEESGVDLFLGGWLNDEFSMYLRREDDDISCRLTRPDSDDVWELDGFSYEESEERLYCMNCIHYREFIDWDIHELVQEDWSLTGLVFACFAFEDDEDTLIASNIPYIDGNVELQRVSDEEYFKFR